MNFYDRIMEKLAERKSTRSDMCNELGISKSACTYWGQGGIPSADVAYKVAKYLGCTVDYLISGDNTAIDGNDLALLQRIKALDPRLYTCLIHNLESFEEIQEKMAEKEQ